AGVYSILVLDDPITFTGQIFGFTGTGPQQSDLIDLKGIAFDTGTSWVYSDNIGSDTGGILTIYETVNGTKSAVYSITFGNGEYTTANFYLASDGNDGTLVAAPPADSSAVPVNSDDVSPTNAGEIIPTADQSLLTDTHTGSGS